MLTLDQLATGQQARIVGYTGDQRTTMRLLEMGLTEGELLQVVTVAPLGDPMDVRVRGYQLSLRRSEAANVAVEMVA